MWLELKNVFLDHFVTDYFWTIFIEKIHFNNDYPEYKNVCITDINRKHALLWNGKKWLRKRYDNIGTDMLDKCLYLISDRMDELEKIVSDHYTFNIKKKTLDRLENINSDEELDGSEDDEKAIKNIVTY